VSFGKELKGDEWGKLLVIPCSAVWQLFLVKEITVASFFKSCENHIRVPSQVTDWHEFEISD